MLLLYRPRPVGTVGKGEVTAPMTRPTRSHRSTAKTGGLTVRPEPKSPSEESEAAAMETVERWSTDAALVEEEVGHRLMVAETSKLCSDRRARIGPVGAPAVVAVTQEGRSLTRGT